MATGIVVGLSRPRDNWGSISRDSNDFQTHTGPSEAASTMMNPSGHHRSYSDAPDSLNKLRLPPISNLIGDAGQPNLSYRPTYQGPQVPSRFQSGSQQVHPPPTPPSSAQWSPSSDNRPLYHHEPSPKYDRHPASEPYFDYHRSSIAQPQTTSPGGQSHSPHGLPPQTSDPLSPGGARTATKTVVREDIIPGKGPCWVYDDGSVCQKVINGDTVNPKWGTTKAGKPRKRLGQACNTCREKKIKCDPSFPKCTQCQKFGRECRFEAPSRAANKSPRMRGSSPVANSTTEEMIRTRRPSVALTEASSHSESGTISSRAGGTADENLSPLTNDSNFLSDAPGPAKKIRLTQTESDLPSLHRTHYDQHHSFAFDTDPYKVNRKLTEAYVSLYFTNVNSSFFCLLPEQMFLKWAGNREEKSRASKLVLYCILAVGCNFSKNSEKFAHGRIFADIALEGISQSFGHSSLQLIQARLIYALYEFQTGRDEKAWDLCGAAMRTALTMKLNLEEGIAQQLRAETPVYGLDQVRLAECMRRTFWTAYTMENLGVGCLCIATASKKAYFCLRLPCTKQAYETGVILTTPEFDGEIRESDPIKALEQTNVGTLGYMMQIASLCCDIRTTAFQASHRAGHDRRKEDNDTRNGLERQLRLWNDNYTAHVRRRFSQRSPSRGDYPFSFGGLHLIYHYACMQIYRNVPHRHLSDEQISENAQLAYYHAEKTLAIAEQFLSRKSQDIFDYHFATASPLSGYAVFYAIDILSAAGINTKLLENQSPIMGLILNSVQLFDNLADSWSSARIQKKLVSDRVTLLNTSAMAGIHEGKIGYCMEEAMVPSMSTEEDLVYGIDRMQYLKCFRWAEQIKSVADLNTISSRSKRTSCSMW